MIANDEMDTSTSVALDNVGIEAQDIELDKGHSIMIDHRDWTDQEVFRLLDGIEKYKDDWNKVCAA